MPVSGPFLVHLDQPVLAMHIVPVPGVRIVVRLRGEAGPHVIAMIDGFSVRVDDPHGVQVKNHSSAPAIIEADVWLHMRHHL